MYCTLFPYLLKGFGNELIYYWKAKHHLWVFSLLLKSLHNIRDLYFVQALLTDQLTYIFLCVIQTHKDYCHSSLAWNQNWNSNPSTHLDLACNYPHHSHHIFHPLLSGVHLQIYAHSLCLVYLVKSPHQVSSVFWSLNRYKIVKVYLLLYVFFCFLKLE